MVDFLVDATGNLETAPSFLTVPFLKGRSEVE
jgi:hypothetical protein